MAVERQPDGGWRIVVDTEHFRELVGGKAIVYSVRGMSVAIQLDAEIGWRGMALTLVDAVDDARKRVIMSRDPPEAREFLPGRRRR